MVKSIGDYKVPFDDKGNLLHYATERYGPSGDNWLDNQPFQAELEIDSMRSGRSAKYVIWKDRFSDRRFPMFLVDLLELIKLATVSQGRTPNLTWVVRKRGQNFGLALLEE